MVTSIKVDNLKITRKELFVIAGPCVIESEAHCLKIAEALCKITKRLKLPFIFKASYDKANRSSISSFRGPGLDRGLEILAQVKTQFGIPVLSDVHEVSQVASAATVLDVLQIPAFLSRQTNLIVEAAKTGKAVNIKKGQFLSPWEMKNVIEKTTSTGNRNIMVTERGSSYGYNNLVVDFRSLPIMRSFGYPVVFDATHSVQLPGATGKASGGNAEFIPYLAKAAVAVGVDGLFFETHDNPAKALSDGPNAVHLKLVPDLLKKLLDIFQVCRSH